MDSFDRRTISGSASHFQALSDPFRISISPINTGLSGFPNAILGPFGVFRE